MHLPNRVALGTYIPHPAHQDLVRLVLPLIEALEVDFVA